MLSVALSAGIAYALRAGNLELPGLYVSATILGVLLTANFMHMAHVYAITNLRRSPVEVGRVLMAWCAMIVTLIAISYFTDTSELFSRVWVTLWFAFSLGGFLMLRALAGLQIDRWQRLGLLELKVAIFGSGPLGVAVDRQMRQLGERQPAAGRLLRPRGRAEEAGQPGASTAPRRAASAGRGDSARRRRRGGRRDALGAGEAEVKRDTESAAALSINVRICPDVFTLYLPVRGLTSVAGVALLDIFERPLSGWDLVLKNLEDRVLTPILFVVFLTLCLLIALAIKLDSRGPVLFRQTRFGFNNNLIHILKFRTMYVDRGLEPGVPQATRNDPRVTRIGRLLRRTSLDELPQLWNVLQRRDVAGRPAAACRRPQLQVRGDDRRISRPPPHEAGDDRLGPGERPARRDPDGRADAAARPIRPQLYRQLVALARPQILSLTLFVGFISKRAY